MAHLLDSQPTGPNLTEGEKMEGGRAINQSNSTTGQDSDNTISYPDGGARAWIVVVGAMCCTFSTFGFVNAWGVFQAHYETQTLKNTSPSDIAWIGSIQFSLVFLPGLISGRLLDLGYFRVPFAVGALLAVVSTLLVGYCTRYWHFLLCQGIAIGVGSGICFGSTFAIVGHWFLKRRGLALGLTTVGASLGGTLYPIAVRQLMVNVRFPWTMRIVALINLTMLSVSIIALTPRLPPKDLPGGMFNLKVFRSAAFTIYSFSGLVAFLGMYTVLTFMDVSAVRSGISPGFSFYLVSISNACSGLGRLATGVLVDKIGAVNIIVPMSFIAAMMTFAWPYARSQGSLVAVAVIYGFSSSAFVTAFNIPIYNLGEMGDIGRRLGMVMFLRAVGALCGPPISGAINQATGGIKAVSYYAGSVILVSIFMMMWTKWLVVGSLWGKF